MLVPATYMVPSAEIAAEEVKTDLVGTIHFKVPLGFIA
jgi:hypothetical protein